MRRSPISRTRRASGVVALLAAAGSAPAEAGVWSLTPEFSADADYSSNPRLNSVTARSGEAAMARIGLPLDWNDGARHVQIRPRANIGASGGDSALGADSYYLSGSADFAWDLSKFMADAQVSDDSSVVRQPDAGTLIRSEIRQHHVDADLQWTSVLTERTTLEASLEMHRVGYGTGPQVGLFDYRSRTGSVSLVRQITERVGLQFAAGRSHFDLADGPFRSDSTYQQAGFSGRLSAKWSYTATYGRSRVSSSASRTQPTGAVYVVSVARTGERAKLALSSSRNLQPSGFGLLALSTEQTARFSWDWTERRSLYLAGRLARSSDVFRSITFAARAFKSESLGLNWQLSQFWDLNAELNHVQADTDATWVGAAARARGTGGFIGASRRFARRQL